MNVMKRNLFGKPSLLFELQRKLQRQINTLFSERYDLISRLREDDTQYYAMLNEDWYRGEWWSAEREAEVGEAEGRRAPILTHTTGADRRLSKAD
jgi:hypothetical protein